MSKSKRHPGRSVKQASPGLRHGAPAGPTGPARRVSRLSPPQVLERIERARVARDNAGAELVVLIDHAVSLGIGWPEIAVKLGVTRQAARQHYQRRHRDGANRQDQVALRSRRTLVSSIWWTCKRMLPSPRYSPARRTISLTCGNSSLAAVVNTRCPMPSLT